MNFISTYCQIVRTIVTNIPLGFPSEDKFYRQERLEDLFDCTLKLITTLNNNLDLKRFAGGNVVTTLQLLFNHTHSADMFTDEMYLRVKSEKHYTLLFNPRPIKGQDGWVVQTRSTDEMSKLSYFTEFDDKPVDKLRTRVSISETIAKLLVEIEKLNTHFTECTDLLQ